jgi:hypothetical protein
VLKKQQAAVGTRKFLGGTAESPHPEDFRYKRRPGPTLVVSTKGVLWYYPGKIMVSSAIQCAKSAKVSDRKNQNPILPMALLAAWR